MDSTSGEGRLRRHIVLRSVLVGWGWGVTTLAGSALVVDQGPATRDLTVVLATTFVAFAVGLWAGAIDPERDPPHYRDRWLAAAALTAVAAAFGTFASLYEQFLPGIHWRIGGLILGVAVPAYALGLIPPVILARFEELVDPDSDAPWVRNLAGVVAIGALSGAALGVILPAALSLPLSAESLLMLTALALLIPLAIAEPEPGSGKETLVFESTSPFGSLRVTEQVFPGERQPERRLYLNGEEESGELVRSGAPTLAYVAAAEHWLNATTPAGCDYLFLGGGAYTLPRRIAERDPEARITVVELDPEVTRIAHRFFGLKQQHGIRSVHGDARAYLDTAGGATCDRLYVDVYGGREMLPYSLVTREAAERMAERLKPGGIVAVNVIGILHGDALRQVWSIVRTFGEVFPALAIYTHFGRDYPDPQNILLVGSLQPDRAFPGAAGLFDMWNRADWPEPEGAVVFRDVNLPQVLAKR